MNITKGAKMEVDIKYDKKAKVVELDNGHQYITIQVEDLKQVKDALDNILRNEVKRDHIEENLKKDWNFLGGL